MAQQHNGGIAKGGGYNNRYKNRCYHCSSYNYKVTDAFLDNESHRRVTRQCTDCYHSWEVASSEEYTDFKSTAKPKVVFKQPNP